MPTITVDTKPLYVRYPWKQTQYRYWKLSLFSGAIDVLVTTYTLGHNNKQDHPNWGKWEVTIGCNYHSRDKGQFFDSAREGIEFADGLVYRMGKRIVERGEQI